MRPLVRRATALAVSLCVLLSPWPAWGQAARVAVPSRAAGAPASGAFIIRPLGGGASPWAAPSLAPLSAPSLLTFAAPVPVERAAAAAAAPGLPAVLAVKPVPAPALTKASALIRPAVFARPVQGRALPEFARGPQARLAEDVREHAVERGFEFGASPAAGAFGAGGMRLSAPSASEPVRSAEPPAAKAPSRARSLSSSLWFILANVALVQLGVEAMSLAVPQFALGAFGYGTMAAVSAASSIALAGGSLLGSWASDKFGPERTYIGTLVARVAVTSALAGLYATGLLPAAALVGLFAADFVLHYMHYVSLDALAPRWLGDDAGRLNRFGVRRQIAVDAAGLLGPLAAGMAIAMWSFGAVFWAYPALFALSTAGGLLALRGRATRFVMARGPVKFKAAGGWGETLRTIVKTPALRWSVAGFALVTVVMMALYFLAGPAFGAAAAAASGGSAAQITSVMTGLFAGGGVLGALLQLRLTKRLEKEAEGFPVGSRDSRKSRALLRQMGWALAAMGAATLGFWALLGTAPLAVFSVFGVSVPLYLAQVLMIPLGAAWAVPTVGLVTILQSQTSAGAKAKAAGINRFLAMLASFAFSLAFGGLFSGVAGTAGFVTLAAIMTAFAAATFLVGWRLARAGRETAVP